MTIGKSDLTEGSSVAELTRAVNALGGRVGQVFVLLRRRIFIGAGVLVLLLGLIGWVSYVAVTSSDTANTANVAASRSESNQNAAYHTCLTTNKAKADAKKLWDTLIVLVSSPTNSAAENAAIAILQNQANITYTPLNCNALPHMTAGK